MGEKRKGYWVDDDEEFLKAASVLLIDLGYEVALMNEVDDFLTKLREEKPDFCMIDLKFGKQTLGFTIIKAIRRVVGNDLPLFVVSGASDSDSVAHALEVGATDYFSKPIDRALVASKLSHYVGTKTSREESLNYSDVSESKRYATLAVDLQVSAVSELGVEFTSESLLSKGMTIRLGDEQLASGLDFAESMLLRITNSWVRDDGESYGAFGEYCAPTEEFSEKVRTWITARSRD